MKHVISLVVAGLAFGACGPLTEKEEGGDLEFQVDLQNDSDVAISLQAVFDRCTIEPAAAGAVAEPRKAFSHAFVGKCDTDEDYDNNEEKLELTSTTGKHDLTITSGCRQAATCSNEGCVTKVDANCREQPTARTPTPPPS